MGATHLSRSIYLKLMTTAMSVFESVTQWYLLGRAGHGGPRLVSGGDAAGHQVEGAGGVAPVLLLDPCFAPEAVHHDWGHLGSV